jgi:hypothetical protein
MRYRLRSTIRCGKTLRQRFTHSGHPSETWLYLLTIQPPTQTSFWLIGTFESPATLAKWHEMLWNITEKNMGADNRQ